MFGKLFGSKPQEKPPVSDPKTEALLAAIRERSKQDPLVGAKLGGKEVLHRLMAAMKGARGVHVESLLCALGALAGYSCQAQLRALAVSKGFAETAAFQTMQTKDGKKYFFGDPLNAPLAGAQYSVWGMAAGAAQHEGAQALPDLNEMFQHTSTVLGSPQFGIPRVPDNHIPGDVPLNYLKSLWPSLFPTIKLFCPDPAQWPVLLGVAIQEAITMGKSVIAPDMALRIVMESAIPMSKVDLANA